MVTIKNKPFVSWAGGKTRLLEVLLANIPNEYGMYYEPFVGGGALFFALSPKQAIINDSNKDLINVYRAVQEDHELLIELVKNKYERHSKDFYYSVRSEYRKGNWTEQAANFLYLNRFCFNGLYRVNRKNEFNVPIKTTLSPIEFKDDIIRNCSIALQSCIIQSKDYNKLPLEIFKKGDFVYLDPPYYPINKDSFLQYGVKIFDISEQYMLRDYCDTLNKHGILFMLSNSDTLETRDLYRNYNILTVQAPRYINCKANGRGNVNEILVKNY